MSDRVVFDPERLAGHAMAATDAGDAVRRSHARYVEAIELVLASGHPATWDSGWVGTTDIQSAHAALERLGSFAEWLAARAERLDQDRHGLVHVDLQALGPLDAGILLSTEARVALAERLGASLSGGAQLDDAEWATIGLVAGDAAFADALVGMVGPTGLVDSLLDANDRLTGGDAPSAGDGPGNKDIATPPELTRLLVTLGAALGASTRRPDWTDDDTDALVSILRAEPGDPGFASGRAAGLAAIVASADRMRPAVLARLLSVAVQVERDGGGQSAWDRRVAHDDTGVWPRPLLDQQGHGTHDVVSTLLVAVDRSPGAGLAAFANGASVSGPAHAPGPVDATLSHLLLDHDFDEVGWARLGAALQESVLGHRGPGAAGRASARVSAQSIALTAERIRRTAVLPRTFQPAATELLADGMPAVVPALAGIDPSRWTAGSADGWTFVDADLHPSGEPVQPAVFDADVRAIVHRLGSNLPAVERLTTAAIATVDLGVRRAGEGGRHDRARLDRATAATGVATGRILTIAHQGVATDHARAQRVREPFEFVGQAMQTSRVPAVVAWGFGIEGAGASLVYEPALPTDYDGLDERFGTDLEQRLRHGLAAAGWLDDPVAATVVAGPSGTAFGTDIAATIPDDALRAARRAFAESVNVESPG